MGMGGSVLQYAAQSAVKLFIGVLELSKVGLQLNLSSISA